MESCLSIIEHCLKRDYNKCLLNQQEQNYRLKKTKLETINNKEWAAHK